MDLWGALPDSLDPAVAERVAGYFAALAASPHNMLGDPPERWVARHLADALALAEHVAEGPLVDVGSGAGLPGLVLAMLAPEREVRLVESRAKRVDFLRETAVALGLTRVSVDHRRAEHVGRDEALRERFAVAVARALAKPIVAAELLLPLVRVGGAAWLHLSLADAESLASASASLASLGAVAREPLRYQLVGDAQPRALLALDKREASDPRYPRREGLPGRRPLPLR